MPLNMADAVRILTFHRTQVHNTVNRQGSGTFSTVESEVPAFTAACTPEDSKGTSPGHTESCVREILGEHTVLYKNKKGRNEGINKIIIGIIRSGERDKRTLILGTRLVVWVMKFHTY